MNTCPVCATEIIGRSDKKYCSVYCKSSYQYQKRKNGDSLFFSIDKQLRKNRSLLKKYNQSGKSSIRKAKLLETGFNPKYFTHYWKSKQGKIYLFCYEFGFMEYEDKNVKRYLLVEHQEYMA